MALTIPANTRAVRQMIREAYDTHTTVWLRKWPASNHDERTRVFGSHEAMLRAIALSMGAMYIPSDTTEWARDLSAVREAVNAAAKEDLSPQEAENRIVRALFNRANSAA